MGVSKMSTAIGFALATNFAGVNDVEAISHDYPKIKVQKTSHAKRASTFQYDPNNITLIQANCTVDRSYVETQIDIKGLGKKYPEIINGDFVAGLIRTAQGVTDIVQDKVGQWDFRNDPKDNHGQKVALGNYFLKVINYQLGKNDIIPDVIDAKVTSTSSFSSLCGGVPSADDVDESLKTIETSIKNCSADGWLIQSDVEIGGINISGDLHQVLASEYPSLSKVYAAHLQKVFFGVTDFGLRGGDGLGLEDSISYFFESRMHDVLSGQGLPYETVSASASVEVGPDVDGECQAIFDSVKILDM